MWPIRGVRVTLQSLERRVAFVGSRHRSLGDRTSSEDGGGVMRVGLVIGLCCVMLYGCGSKDPDDGDDATPSAGGGGKGSTGGKGGARDAGSEHDAGSVHDGGGNGGRDAGDAHDGGAGDGDDECQGPFLPMAVGNRWTYRVISPVDGTSMKEQTIDSEEEVGGSGPNADKTAFHAVTAKMSGQGMDKTESWQAVLDDGSVVRYRELEYKAGTDTPNGEEHWDPYKLRIDQSPEHLGAGATWNERYAETKIDKGVATTASRDDGWKVEGVDVPCGPVKGEMLSCIKLSKGTDGADTGKTYWFARCVGKVREQGSQVEELVDYELVDGGK